MSNEWQPRDETFIIHQKNKYIPSNYKVIRAWVVLFFQHKKEENWNQLYGLSSSFVLWRDGTVSMWCSEEVFDALVKCLIQLGLYKKKGERFQNSMQHVHFSQGKPIEWGRKGVSSASHVEAYKQEVSYIRTKAIESVKYASTQASTSANKEAHDHDLGNKR